MKKAKTEVQFPIVLEEILESFEKEYVRAESTWRVLRISSITDQIFIAMQRLREAQENHVVLKDLQQTYLGIIRYCVKAAIQLHAQGKTNLSISLGKEVVLEMAKNELHEATKLMLKKNHDYDEAWRQMRVSSITDLMLMKVLRLRQIENNDGKTLISEGPLANFRDIVNYCIFSIIRITEED